MDNLYINMYILNKISFNKLYLLFIKYIKKRNSIYLELRFFILITLIYFYHYNLYDIH